MKLKVGNIYKISDKLKKAFGVIDDDAKIISISGGIVMFQIGVVSFPLKEVIALSNLSETHELSARFAGKTEESGDEIKDNSDNNGINILPDTDDIPNNENDDETVVEPVEETPIPEQVVAPEPEEVIKEEPEPENIIEEPITPEPVIEPEPENIIEEEPITPDPNIDNSIVITPGDENIEKKPTIIEEEPQDNIVPESVVEPEPLPDEYNPDDEWGF